MKKIMFSDKYLLTQAVLNGSKTMTRRVLRDNVPLGNWEEVAKARGRVAHSWQRIVLN